MIDPNFDPMQELIDLRIELELVKANISTLISAHNAINRENVKLRRWQTEMQQDLLELRHKVDGILDNH
jgi:hypothetical protein